MNDLLIILAEQITLFFLPTGNGAAQLKYRKDIPLTTFFYKELIGCQSEDVQWCYRVAKPGTFKGSLGFELIKTFQVNPSFFSFEFNSQFAEEAFTVYDHPKVFIFRKTNRFEINSVIEKFSAVNLEPGTKPFSERIGKASGNLYSEDEQINLQKKGGTWSDIIRLQRDPK